jgi:hypothetical protein
MIDYKLEDRWLKAGIALGRDPTAKVLCPVCARSNLIVRDVPIDGTSRIERFLICPSCYSSNAMLINTKQ